MAPNSDEEQRIQRYLQAEGNQIERVPLSGERRSARNPTSPE
jgi:hypothetical protein